jgi:hypothetical protein
MRADSVVRMVWAALDNDDFPFSVHSDNLDRDYETVRQILFKHGLSEVVGLTRETSRNLLWFRLRKEQHEKG